MLRLLIVDDSLDERALIIYHLQREFPTLEVEQVTQAEAFNLALGSNNFDLVITDYRLRWSDGLTVLHEIKSSYPNCPVIMFTDSGNQEIAVEAMKAGLDDYIVKSSKHYARLPVAVRSVLNRKRAEEALRFSQEQLRIAQKAASAGLWDWDIIANKLTWSEEYYDLYGLAPATPPSYENWLASILEEDRSRVDREICSAWESCGEINIEFRIWHQQRGVRWLVVIGRTFYNASGCPERMTGLTLDLTERKREEALRQSEERFRYLANAIPQIVWTCDANGLTDYVNQRWHEYTGLTLEQTVGYGWGKALHPDDMQRSAQFWLEALQNGTPYEIEERYRRASDGTYRWHLTRGLPLKDEQGRIVKWYGTCVDINEQKQLEEERAQLLAREQAARTEAEEANRIKDEFLAIVSHELRTPLSCILGWSKLLHNCKLDEAQTAEALATIERNASLQEQLIEDLLDFSRILRGKLSLNFSPVNLVSTIKAALETVRLAAEAKSIQLTTVFDANVGEVEGDPNRLQQVVCNLLSNAVKFTLEGGQVQLRLERVGSTQAQIQVIDTGKGISPDFLPYVFDYFRQQDGKTTKKFGGLGLGLAIVRKIVELHGGTVMAESPGVGQGATFTVRLPLMTSDPETLQDSEPHDVSLNLSDIKVLIVDDDADLLKLIAFILEQYGASVTAVASATEAIEALAKTLPEVLVSDIGMPEIDGYMLMRTVRTWSPEQGGQIPAIALTAYAREFDNQQALRAGFQMHVPKPVEPYVLVAAVASLAGRGKQGSLE